MLVVFFFFKQKTAYEMRISDWSSDVCSSDLIVERPRLPRRHRQRDQDRRRRWRRLQQRPPRGRDQGGDRRQDPGAPARRARRPLPRRCDRLSRRPALAVARKDRHRPGLVRPPFRRETGGLNPPYHPLPHGKILWVEK